MSRLSIENKSAKEWSSPIAANPLLPNGLMINPTNPANSLTFILLLVCLLPALPPQLNNGAGAAVFIHEFVFAEAGGDEGRLELPDGIVEGRIGL